MNFFQTRMGRKFFEGDIPKLIRAVDRLAQAVEESNRLKQQTSEDESLRDK